MQLVLFDIDGTLLLTGGAGMRAFHRAMRSNFGIDADAAKIRPDGKTDPLIARELLACFDLADRWTAERREALFSSYLLYLEEEMRMAKELGQIRILPGVVNLLEMLSLQPDFCIGLVTGNLEKGALVKLENSGLSGYFKFGGYGSDSEDRTELTRIGIRRGTRAAAPAPVEGAYVIGDTPLDVIHGHAAGAKVVAVASAGYTMEDLAPHHPEMLVPDLTRAESLIGFMRHGSGSCS